MSARGAKPATSRGCFWLAAALSCQPAAPQTPIPQAAPQAPAPPSPQPPPPQPRPIPEITHPLSSTLATTPRTTAAPRTAPPTTPPITATPSTPPPSTPLACIAPADPEFDRESAWSKAIGERLQHELPKLEQCTHELPAGQSESVTLRFIYEPDGAPRSQHVVAGPAVACGAADCLQRALARVRAPKLAIEQGAFDLPLVLTRGAAPRRTHDEHAGLSDDAANSDPESCVDPVSARLSRAAVDEIVRASFPQLGACHAQAIARDHLASGTVTFEFVIGRQGEVALVQARDATLRDCQAIECMLEPFRQLRFPPPLGRSVRVIYPIRYSIEQPPVQLR